MSRYPLIKDNQDLNYVVNQFWMIIRKLLIHSESWGHLMKTGILPVVVNQSFDE